MYGIGANPESWEIWVATDLSGTSNQENQQQLGIIMLITYQPGASWLIIHLYRLIRDVRSGVA